MAQKRKAHSSLASAKSAGEQLDELNARLRSGRAGTAIRRAMEAHLQSKAKRRRGNEPTTSSLLK
jgi:hypothetical protein